MTEEQELQAKIAALSGRINLHKQYGGDPLAPRHGGYNSYGFARGRAGKHTTPIHRNRTLVLNGANANANGLHPATESSDPDTMWISKHDRHKQLINASVYNKVTQERAQQIAETAKKKYQRVLVDNIPFAINQQRTKLTRLHHDPSQPTPERYTLHGVTFTRSKGGNMYRSGIFKPKKSVDSTVRDQQAHSDSSTPAKKTELCSRFTTTGSYLPVQRRIDDSCLSSRQGLCHVVDPLTDSPGTCSKGPHCRYVHDANKVAICKDFLLKESCPFGDACDLSHDPTPHRVPACVHFLRGNCTNDACRYAHIRVNPGASVCRSFASLGYCEKGADCTERHLSECPDYADKGICPNPRCRLPHVDRAGQLRKAAAAAKGSSAFSSHPTTPEESHIVGSEDDSEEGYEDIDSDEVDEDVDDFSATHALDHALSQQQDFVSL